MIEKKFGDRMALIPRWISNPPNLIKSLDPNKPGVSIVTCTHLPLYMENILDNFSRQTYPYKELLVILDQPDFIIENWQQKNRSYRNVRIFQMPQKTTVGACMNFAVEQVRFPYIANFDHDDYYGAGYLNDFIEVAPYSDAGLFGKKTHYVYMEESQELSLFHPGKENCYVSCSDGCIAGCTMFVKKTVFEKVKFIDHDISDCQFSWDCQNNGIKIYSVNRFNFAYIRKKNIQLHTWRMANEEIIHRYCQPVGKVSNFRRFVDRII